MKKKTLSILLTVAMMFSLISLPQAAAEVKQPCATAEIIHLNLLTSAK